ncbi:hypothetical protein LAZ67_8001517 [Cordylochernes scorpioides]|uniref:Uncharacterized protein n=1 Tax=Cordylochernes scorpioides TaxID=51811 RepID=A0ABY6KQB4_9ARAC|nr:hypothetical protein LAZ67_8001517 [Cordylochernes scorpioides]
MEDVDQEAPRGESPRARHFTTRTAMYVQTLPAHLSSVRPYCIACGSREMSLAHRYWSYRCIRPLIPEDSTIIDGFYGRGLNNNP